MKRALAIATFVLAAYAAVMATPGIRAQERQVVFFTGTAEHPGLVIEGTRTGFFAKGNSGIGISVNGREVATIDDTGFAGTSSLPSFTDDGTDVTIAPTQSAAISTLTVDVVGSTTNGQVYLVAGQAGISRDGQQGHIWTQGRVVDIDTNLGDITLDSAANVNVQVGLSNGVFTVEDGSLNDLFVVSDVGAGTATFNTQLISMASSLQVALGSPADGSWKYCSNCNRDATCTSGGTGSFAFRINGAWTCTP